jgi:hypothetical protein
MRYLLRPRVRGQAAVLAALCFVVLVACLGLALDGANAFGQRRVLANAADAAALAGARELIARRDQGGGSTHINHAIEEFLTGQNGLDADDLTWRAFYVDRLSPDGSLGQIVNGARPPSGADGVRVELSYAFPTYFMGVFGQVSLSVSGRAAAVFGPLGTAVGQDLAPLALSRTAQEILERNEGENVTIDMREKLALDRGWLFDPTLLPDDVITMANIAHVSFANVDEEPETGDDCVSGPADSLTYWWCQGSPNKLRINRKLPHTAAVNYGRLNSAIEWREDHRPIMVLPVYADVGDYQLVNFIAVEIRGYDDSMGTLEVRYLPDYATAGAMIGDGSGAETGVWAVNLTR